MRPIGIVILIAAAATLWLTFANVSSACGPAADCSAGVCEVTVTAIVVQPARIVRLLRPRGCGLFRGVQARRAARVDRRAVRQAVRGRWLFRGRLLRGGCCG